jgi:hypothetical protein
MKLRLLAALPFVLTAALVVMVRMTAGMPVQPLAMRIEVEILKTLALIGCVVAAFSFERGEYMRRAWLLSGGCYAFLLLRDLTVGQWTPWAPGPKVLGVPTELVESALVIVANVGAVWGTLMLARAWQVAGLSEVDSRWRRRALFIVALIIAIVVVGSNVRIDLMALAKGNVSSLVMLVSDVGDVASLALIAPVLLTALALRGGLLLWPWALLTASLLGWLFYDAATVVGFASHTLLLTGEIFRTLACAFAFSAGLAQRIVLGENAAPVRAT